MTVRLGHYRKSNPLPRLVRFALVSGRHPARGNSRPRANSGPRTKQGLKTAGLLKGQRLKAAKMTPLAEGWSERGQWWAVLSGGKKHTKASVTRRGLHIAPRGNSIELGSPVVHRN